MKSNASKVIERLKAISERAYDQKCRFCKNPVPVSNVVFNFGESKFTLPLPCPGDCTCIGAENHRKQLGVKTKPYEEVIKTKLELACVPIWQAKDIMQKGIKPDEQMLDALSNSRNVYIHGETQTGKTYSVISCLLELIEVGSHALYVDLPQFLAKKKDSFSSGDVMPIEEMLKRKDFVFIDNLGRENITQWSKSILFSILDTCASNGVLVTTSSHIAPQWLKARYGNDDIGQGILSRLLGNTSLFSLSK